MENLPVTLIVKAPNQQIEDQTIKCELSWTINKLKQHLSEVYPSRPPKHEQKLIYSGQLLNDSVVLKDVLRQYDGQETHTVHLVCTTRQSAPKKQAAVPTKPQPPMPDVSTEAARVPLSTPSNADQRVPAPNVPWLNAPPIDPQQYALQMAWMQQAYLQYLTHYMNLAANSAEGVNIPQIPLNQPNDLAQAAAARRDNLGAPPAPEAAAAPPQQPAQPQRDPDNPERDWLDLFYIFSRVMVLFSVVYFYSSPLRFIFVLFLGIGLYLYQIGFFRNINYNNNNNNNNVPPEPVAQEIQAPSRLMVVWTFFTTFFASLIPEIPNAV